jgi:hypothetical protein
MTAEQKDEALRMYASGMSWRSIADHFGLSCEKHFGENVRRHAVRKARCGEPVIESGRGSWRPDWTEEQHATLVAMAPTGCGGAAIAEELGKPLGGVRSYASLHRIKIKRAPETFSNCGGSTTALARNAPPKPYVKPERVFAGVSFAAPPGRHLPGTARPVPTRGRLGLPPVTVPIGREANS